MKRPHLLLYCAAFIMLFAGTVVVAQNLTCPELVQRAFSELGNTCAGQSRNSACYGYNQVSASFSQTVPATFFTKPADLAGLNMVSTIQTAPLDEAAGTWGIVTMNVQANLPAALPGQGTVYILLGDIKLDNAVPPDEALVLPENPLNVTTKAKTDLHVDPRNNADVVGTVAAGATLQADGTSANGNWLRVYYLADRKASAWVKLSDVDASGDVSSLPVITPTSQTPMQAFQFSTNVTGTTCEDAPSALVVQGPEHLQVDINANGADIRVGSTIALQRDDENHMVATVLSGGVTLNPNSNAPITMLPGYYAICDLTTIQNGNCDWTLPQPYTEAIQIMVDALRQLFDLAPNIFNYVASPPTVVCGSGVGQVICEFSFDNPNVDLNLAQEICQGPDAPDACSTLFP